MPTQKQLQEQYIKNQEEILRHIGNLTGEFSVMKNDIDRALSYLENNDKTNQKGIVEQVEINANDIQEIKTDRKVTKGKIAMTIIIFTSIGTAVSWILGIFDR